MKTFKKGDKVRSVNSGNIYTIKGINSRGFYICEETPHPFDECQLELTKKVMKITEKELNQLIDKRVNEILESKVKELITKNLEVGYKWWPERGRTSLITLYYEGVPFGPR